MDTALKSHIAENLRKHRVLRGYTQEYIAEYLGKKDYTAYSRYEQGRSNLNPDCSYPPVSSCNLGISVFLSSSLCTTDFLFLNG
ncbi:helix-turn-helix domain-containing protein [Cecembia calidifontis]|uniref:Helix-turn-helix protein n=1 Tax=Cecembia calidifontis TaxID=1187080 RepID=A0A4Q7P438_9BACT|nr:helix-turn-helix transcriptional regulator [Cecembia calidifontis]RZS94713.1 helix-turn-helix protein [Cecembia calidifontis]